MTEHPSQDVYLPKWILHYDLVSYFILSIHLACDLIYLSFLAVWMSDRKLYLPFEPSRKWLELHSNFILPPICNIPLVTFIAYHIRRKSLFFDGDFYGFIGVMIGMVAFSLFHAIQVGQAISDVEAWNSKNFSRAFTRGIQGVVAKSRAYVVTYNDALHNITMNVRFEEGMHGFIRRLDGFEVFEMARKKKLLPPGGTWEPAVKLDGGIRRWTHEIQRELHCCGSDSYKDWDYFEGKIYSDGLNEEMNEKYGMYPPSCYCTFPCSDRYPYYENCFAKCKNSSDPESMEILEKRRGCYSPYLDFLVRLYNTSTVFMVLNIMLYLCSITCIIVHAIAMRQKDVYIEMGRKLEAVEEERRAQGIEDGELDEEQEGQPRKPRLTLRIPFFDSWRQKDGRGRLGSTTSFRTFRAKKARKHRTKSIAMFLASPRTRAVIPVQDSTTHIPYRAGVNEFSGTSTPQYQPQSPGGSRLPSSTDDNEQKPTGKGQKRRKGRQTIDQQKQLEKMFSARSKMYNK